MAAWIVWLIIAAVLGAAEIFTLTAALGLLGGAALLTGGAAAIGLPVPVQLLVFAVASTAGIVLLRPVVATTCPHRSSRRSGSRHSSVSGRSSCGT